MVPETPQEHYNYFAGCQQMLGPEPHWNAGVYAAELWIAYHAQPQDADNLLVAIVQTLMPYRWAGSGFHAFWLTMLQHLHQTPILPTSPVWRAVFHPAHHGDRPVPACAVAEWVIQEWQQAVAALPAPTPVGVEALVEALYPHFGHTEEWFGLTTAIGTWFAQGTASPSFLELVVARYNQTRAQLGT